MAAATTTTITAVRDGWVRVMAFDIGIKNLAYCILDKPARAAASAAADGSGCQIVAWENVNLLTDGKEPAAKTVCGRCAKGAKYAVLREGSETTFYCARHVPADRPPVAAADTGKPLTSMPPVASLKEIAAKAGLGRPAGSAKKEDWVALLATKFALPLTAVKPVQKVTKALGASLETLHDAILAMILDDRRYDTFMSCTQVLLENQPVLKNPTMKTVQILLFATLRDNFKAERDGAPVPAFHLVHAGKKVRGVEAGDAGYAARKEGGEARVRTWLAAHAAGSRWDALFTGAAKKSDLADALCMCLDF
jgi:hypothetical protein